MKSTLKENVGCIVCGTPVSFVLCRVYRHICVSCTGFVLSGSHVLWLYLFGSQSGHLLSSFVVVFLIIFSYICSLAFHM